MEDNYLSLLIKAIEAASSPGELVRSVKVLADAHDPAAIPTLIKVLGYNNPGAAIAAMHGLVAIGREAVPSLLTLMDDYNYGARAYTIRALAMIGEPQALETLLYCAVQDFAPSVRRAAIKGLSNLQWSWVDWSQERIFAAQERILFTLSSILKDTDWSMRYATAVALDKLAGNIPNSLAKEAEYPAIAARKLLESALSQEAAQQADLAVIARIQIALSKHLVIA